jgi:2-amino-4-hydroxy-6-hydroxymethyldihydropteridine diphosphokinase
VRLVYIALGSNIGDRAAWLARGVAEMNRAGVRVLRQSAWYETEPVGGPPQEWFLNGVVEAETDLQPLQLLDVLRGIEQMLGRQRAIPSGPRTLDLDYLLDSEKMVHTSVLEVPHPRLAERRFVLRPLAELAPDLLHPILRKTISQLLASVKDSSQVRVWRSPEGGSR